MSNSLFRTTRITAKILSRSHARFYASTEGRVAGTTKPSSTPDTVLPPSAYPGPSKTATDTPVPSRDPILFPTASKTFENELLRSSPMHTSASNASSNAKSNGDDQAKELGQLNGTFGGGEDLTFSFRGAAAEPFPQKAADILMAEIPDKDIEIKPDGMIYLPEIKYRRILNRAFGPGGWGLVPRGPHSIGTKTISREYALFCLGRFVSVARGEQDYFGSTDGLPTAAEGCKSNALMRCCKDLGIASELWDPAFIRQFKDKHCVQVWASTSTGKKILWRRKDRTLDYPFKEEGPVTATPAAAPKFVKK